MSQIVKRSAKFEDLKGRVISDIIVNEDKDEMRFDMEDGRSYLLYHNQDCCEGVYIEDICGDLKHLIGYRVEMAEETSNGETETASGCERWTFYKLATINGYVTIRWYGESNGYYGVEVSFAEIAQ